MTQAMSQSPSQTQTLITCPACGKLVDQALYLLHINGDSEHGPHELKVIDIKGVGAQVIPQNTTGKAQPKMMDLPFLGRVRTDAFVLYTLIMLLIGYLLGLRII